MKGLNFASPEFEGRIVAVRKHRQTVFCDVDNGLIKRQAVFESSSGNTSTDIKTGDIVRCDGEVRPTKSGQESLFVNSCNLLCRPVEYPGEDLELRELLLNRAKAETIIRNNFVQQGLVEVDSRIMSPYSGTANIVPFSVCDIEGVDSYLRFTMELELKKYICRTQLPIFEFGKLFRNLGTSNRRETEFMAIEAYIPYMGLNDGIDFVSRILGEIGEQFSVNLSNIPRHKVLDLLQSQSREVYNKIVKKAKEPTFLLSQPADWASPFTKSNLDGTACDAKFVYAGAGSIVHLNEESGDYDGVLAKLKTQFEKVKMERPGAQLDAGFLEEFKRGLPPCLGIFISFDRLMMTLLKKATIREVMPGKLVT